jgi:hypothetical protein
MRLIYFLVCCLLHITLKSELPSIRTEQEPVPISLGTHCVAAYMLNHHKIRTVSFPFDWLSTPFSALYSAIEDDFQNFFLKEHLLIPIEKPSQVIDTKTGIVYTHDFPTKDVVNPDKRDGDDGYGVVGTIVDNFLDFYETINEKYLRRINRLREVLNSSRQVVFFRYECSYEEAVALRDLIKKKYPTLNFKLVIINYYYSDPWNEELIQNYFMPAERAWDINGNEWLTIFREQNLVQ